RSMTDLGKEQSESGVAATALSELSDLKGRPRKSGANCSPTICWRPSDRTLLSLTTPDSMFEKVVMGSLSPMSSVPASILCLDECLLSASNCSGASAPQIPPCLASHAWQSTGMSELWMSCLTFISIADLTIEVLVLQRPVAEISRQFVSRRAGQHLGAAAICCAPAFQAATKTT